MEIFKLFGSILINTDDSDKSLSKTDSKAKSVASTLGSGIKTAAKWGAAIVTAAAGAAKGMYDMATSAAATADDIDKMSQKIGVSREGYQELSFALSQSGTDVSKLQAGLKTLSTQAEKGNSYFEQLGVSLTDVNGNAKNQEQLFYDVVDALQKMEAGTEKTTIATTLLGKSGTELMPLLNSEAGSLQAMREQAHELGLVMDDDLVNNGVNLTDALDQMKRSLSAVMTQLGGRLMPIVEKAADFITENVPKINKLVEGIAPIFEETFDKILPVLMDLASELLPQLVSVVTAILPPLSNIFAAITPIITKLSQKIVPLVGRLIEKLLPPLVKILDSLTPILDIVIDLLDPILGLVDALIDPIADVLEMIAPILTVAVQLISEVLKPIQPLLSAVTELLGDYLGGAIESVSGLLDGLLGIFSGVLDFLNGDFDRGIHSFADGFVNIFSNAFGLIDGIFGTNLKKWYDDVTAFWRDAGAKLYEVFHADELAAVENETQVTNIRNDIVQASNQYMREGMEAGEALAKAKEEILNTSEKLALFNAQLADQLTDEEAKQRQNTLRSTGQIGGNSGFNPSDYYSNHFKTPHLASGGVVYGKTLAVVGDNANVRSDPEVVAPLSDLQNAVGADEIMSELRTISALLKQMINSDATINMDGQRVASIVTNKINAMRYTRGGEVVYT